MTLPRQRSTWHRTSERTTKDYNCLSQEPHDMYSTVWLSVIDLGYVPCSLKLQWEQSAMFPWASLFKTHSLWFSTMQKSLLGPSDHMRRQGVSTAFVGERPPTTESVSKPKISPRKAKETPTWSISSHSAKSSAEHTAWQKNLQSVIQWYMGPHVSIE